MRRARFGPLSITTIVGMVPARDLLGTKAPPVQAERRWDQACMTPLLGLASRSAPREASLQQDGKALGQADEQSRPGTFNNTVTGQYASLAGCRC